MSPLDLAADYNYNYVTMNIRLIMRACHMHDNYYYAVPHLNPADFKPCLCLSFLSFANLTIADATDNINIIAAVIIKTTTITIAAIPPAAYKTQFHIYN